MRFLGWLDCKHDTYHPDCKAWIVYAYIVVSMIIVLVAG